MLPGPRLRRTRCRPARNAGVKTSDSYALKKASWATLGFLPTLHVGPVAMRSEEITADELRLTVHLDEFRTEEGKEDKSENSVDK